MENEGIVFNVKLAGVPIGIRCRYRENRDFFESYRTDAEAAFEASVTEADKAFTEARLRAYYGEGAELGSEPDLENIALMYVISRKLLDFSVLMIHGSALCMDGAAYIFIAPSGTGKSTHTRLWRETFGDRVWMVNDDKPMVRIEDGKAVVYGTPWNGKHGLGRNAAAPLKAVVWLTRSDVNRIEPLGRADAFPVLMGHTAWAGAGTRKPSILRLETALLEAAEFYKLDCNTDPEAARIAWSGMQNGLTGYHS